MAKKNTNPTGRVSVDLFNDKKELDRQAKASGTTTTNLMRIFARHCMAKMASGEFAVTQPDLAPTTAEGQP